MKKYPPLEIVAPVMFAFVFMMTLIYSKYEPHVEDVNIDYVKAHIGRPGYVLVDVREEDIFDGAPPKEGVPGGHIAGSVNFPLSELKVAAASAALAKTGIVKSRTIILYCNRGTTAGRFADAMIRQFHFSPTSIKNYRGSVIDWVNRGNKLISSYQPENDE